MADPLVSPDLLLRNVRPMAGPAMDVLSAGGRIARVAPGIAPAAGVTVVGPTQRALSSMGPLGTAQSSGTFSRVYSFSASPYAATASSNRAGSGRSAPSNWRA